MINRQCQFWKNLEYCDGFRLEESIRDKQAYLFLEGPTKLEALRTGK